MKTGGILVWAFVLALTLDLPVLAATFTVTSSDPSGTGTLAQAIEDVNAASGSDQIIFDLAGSAPFLISLDASLPTITDTVMIDGTTQPGYPGTPVIVLRSSTNKTILRIEADDSMVRGLVFELSGGGTGLRIDSEGSGNSVFGCYFGTDHTGTQPQSQEVLAVAVYGPHTRIGGPAPGEGNVIFGGNSCLSFLGSAHNSVAQGNLIGVDSSGMVSFAAKYGVLVRYCQNVLIGGAEPGEGNVIAGATEVNLHVEAGMNTRIMGNYIGMNAAGTSGMPDQRIGIEVWNAKHTWIGGPQPGEGNVIAGLHSLAGIYILNSTGPTVIRGNKLGTTPDGMSGLPSRVGIFIDGYFPFDVGNIRIGGPDPGEGNLISGHTESAIHIDGPEAHDIIIQGNTIGTDILRTGNIGNGHDGVTVRSGPTDILIGGTDPGAGNWIANSGRIGINVCRHHLLTTEAFVPQRVTVLGNSIFGNGSIGYDLSQTDIDGDGPTPNDPLDADTGPNGFINKPFIESAVAVNGGGARVIGNYDGAPNQTFRLEFFANTIPGALGLYEGQRFLGFRNLTTDDAGRAEIDLFFPGTFTTDEQFTATATDAEGNTSEFSVVEFETVPVTLSRFTLE